MTTYTAIDLSTLPAPDVVETLSFEAILAVNLTDLQVRDPAFTALVESDPAYKILEVCSYRELLLRQRVNDACRAVMLAFALGGDLDQIGARFNVARLVIVPADPDAVPPVAAVMESDTDFRRRIQLSLEGFSTAGPEGAYVFHALSADSDVLDVSATSPEPGEVLICVLSRTGDGTAGSPLLTAVETALSAESVRPLTDLVTVQSAEIVEFTVVAQIYVYPGPDGSVVLSAAQAKLTAYLDSVHRMGKDVTLSGLYAALHQPGVQRVDLITPTANLTIDVTEAAFCTSINLTLGGIDE